MDTLEPAPKQPNSVSSTAPDPKSSPNKIVYLFGTGAAQAEIQLKYGAGLDLEKDGLRNRDISGRVIEAAKRTRIEPGLAGYLNKFPASEIKTGEPDIELLIGLLESSGPGHSEAALNLRGLFKHDIESRTKTLEPVLSKDLIEQASLLDPKKEEILAYLTLNYDDLFERAYQDVHKVLPNYGFDLQLDGQANDKKGPPYLKLHGSFDWESTPDSEGLRRVHPGSSPKQEHICWIPPTIHKEYDEYPYNLLWGKAHEALSRCNVLRIVGCSISPNDAGLMSLLFRASLLREKPFEIEIIASASTTYRIRKRFGWCFNIPELDFDPKHNAFSEWLNTRKQALDATKTEDLSNLNPQS